MKAKIGKVLLGGLVLLVVHRMVEMVPRFKESYREERNLEQTFDQYTISLVSHHYEEAYAICGNDFHQATPYDKFVSITKSLEDQYGPLKSAKCVGFEMHGRGTPTIWTAVIDANFVYAKQTLKFKFSVNYEGDRWFLYGFEQG